MGSVMRSSKSRRVSVAGVAVAAAVAMSSSASANPIKVTVVDAIVPLCGSVPRTTLNEEVGVPSFPKNETIEFSALPRLDLATDCVGAGTLGGGDDYLISLTNITGHTLRDVYWIADDGVTFANFDGVIEGRGNPVKFLADRWIENSTITFALMDSSAAPLIGSLGVPSGNPLSTYSVAGVVPEPSSLALIASGLLGLFATRRRNAFITDGG